MIMAKKKKKISKKAKEVLDALLGKPKCSHCRNLDEIEGQEGRRPWHGRTLSCDECGAEYYREYERDTWATNKQASINHPELKVMK